MLIKKEFEQYRAIVESENTKIIMGSIDPNSIARMGCDFAAYYARLSGELAEIKDAIDREYCRLIKPEEEGGDGYTATAATRVAEVNINSQNQVSRRSVEYLMESLHKLSMACGVRIKSFNKEGHY